MWYIPLNFNTLLMPSWLFTDTHFFCECVLLYNVPMLLTYFVTFAFYWCSVSSTRSVVDALGQFPAVFASGYLIFYIRINLEFHAIYWKQLLSLWILISRTANSRGSQPPPRHMVFRRPFAVAVVVEACWTPCHRQQSAETIRPPGQFLGVWTALPHGSHVRMVVKKMPFHPT